jgi:hypothetical protein
MPDNSTASHAVGTLPTVSDGQAQPVDANRLPVPCRAARGGRAARPGLTVAHPIRDIRPVTPMSYRCHVIPASLATDQIRPGGGAGGRSRRHTQPAGVLAARVDRAELRDALGARGFGDSQRERSPMRDDRSKRRRVALLSPRLRSKQLSGYGAPRGSAGRWRSRIGSRSECCCCSVADFRRSASPRWRTRPC